MAREVIPMTQNAEVNQSLEADELLSAAAAEVAEIQRKEPLTFVLVGKAGVGKSSTVNTLMGREVAKTSDERVMTADVTKYEGEFDGIKLNIFDTPGLADTSKRDKIYLENIREIAKPQDILLYVRPLYETRLLQDDENAIRRVTDTFGPAIWGQTVLVLTFADMYPDRSVLEHKTDARTKETRASIASAIQDFAGTHPEQGAASLPNAQDIPAVAFSNTQMINPWGRRYLTLLYTAVVERISSRGSVLFLIATAKRLLAGMEAESAAAAGFAPAAATQAKAIFPDAELKEAVDVRVRTDIMGSTVVTVALATLGAALAGTLSVTVGVGAAIGAGIGAVISFFSWLGDKIRAAN
jgi:small GTP-binding protein